MRAGNQLPFGGFPAVKSAAPRPGQWLAPAGAAVRPLPKYGQPAAGKFRLHGGLRCGGDLGEVVAIVHSHPDATSRPSPHDLAMCEASGLPWHILSWPEGDLRTIAPQSNIPLLGRPFVHGAWDCWQVCADWYQREWGLEFERFAREDGWWEQVDGPSLYEQHFQAAGFCPVDQPRGDMIVFEVGRTQHPNHAIYLGTDAALPGTVRSSAPGHSCCTTSTASQARSSSTAGTGLSRRGWCCGTVKPGRQPVLRSGVWSAGRAGKVQKLIVILLAVIVVLIAPWTLAVLFAGVLAYGIWLAVVGLITAIFVAGYMYKNSEGRRQRQIQKVVDAANKRNRSQGMKP